MAPSRPKEGGGIRLGLLTMSGWGEGAGEGNGEERGLAGLDLSTSTCRRAAWFGVLGRAGTGGGDDGRSDGGADGEEGELKCRDDLRRTDRTAN